MKDAFWGYCAPQGMSARGKECVRECTFEKYWWCRTNEDDEDEWDYCSPPNMVEIHTYPYYEIMIFCSLDRLKKWSTPQMARSVQGSVLSKAKITGGVRNL